VLLLLMRPWRHWYPQKHISAEETDRLRSEIKARITGGERWAYWEAQKNPYSKLLVVGGALMLLLSAMNAVDGSERSALWERLIRTILPLAMPALLLFYCQIRVSVTSKGVEVRLGLFRWPVMRLAFSDLAAVEVHTFFPLDDLGRSAPPRKRRMKGYAFRGNRGVLLRTNAGKQYLIGSDNPERLAAVIAAAKAAA
jgi:hypothetical protein